MREVVRTSELTALVSLADAKENLRVEHTDEDALISRLSLAVTDMMDGYTGETGQALVVQTVQFTTCYMTRFIYAPVGPIRSVTSAVGLDADGNELTGTLTVERSGLNMDQFTIDDFDGDETPAYMRITYEAGPEDGQTAPPSLIQAAHLLIGHYYENRENSAMSSMKPETIPDSARTLIDRHRKYWAA